MGSVLAGRVLIDSLFPRPVRRIAPGAVHVPDWLNGDEQRRLANACRAWAAGPVPARSAKLPTGQVMSVETVCLGWHWKPYAYTRVADDVNGKPVLSLPSWLVDLGGRAVQAAYGAEYDGPGYCPDAALINYYRPTAVMGMHQDEDESSSEPVVSLSLGATCLFRFGNTVNRNKPYADVELRSGDLFVFGGPARLAYHGVTRVLPTADHFELGLGGGRINLTMRATGLT